MSKVTEFLALIPRGLKNPRLVLDGFINDIKLRYSSLPQEEQDEILRRRLICMGCPFMSENAKTSEEYFKMTGSHYKTDRRDTHCSSCGCPLDKKTASLDSDCGLTVLNNKYPDNQVLLKWTKFKDNVDDSSQLNNK